MFIAQAINASNADFAAIPSASVFKNKLDDRINWQAVAPGQIVTWCQPPDGVSFAAWQSAGNKIAIQDGGARVELWQAGTPATLAHDLPAQPVA